MSLRNALVAKIWNSLEQSPFTPADFIVDLNRSDALLLVTFRHSPAFKFTATETYKGELFATCSPGAYKATERVQLNTLAELPDLVLNWSRNVRDELRTTVPVYSELDALRETIEKHINEHIESPETPFSNDEAEELRAKLDELAEKFQQMQEHNELTQQEVNRLNQEITAIKANLAAYPRGVWYKTAANKIWIAVSKVGTSKESRQVLAQAAQKLLGLDQ